MIVVPPRHYCIIENPVAKNDDGEILLDKSGQVKLCHADLDIRLAQEPFPLYPGEVLKKVCMLYIVYISYIVQISLLSFIFSSYIFALLKWKYCPSNSSDRVLTDPNDDGMLQFAHPSTQLHVCLFHFLHTVVILFSNLYGNKTGSQLLLLNCCTYLFTFKLPFFSLYVLWWLLHPTQHWDYERNLTSKVKTTKRSSLVMNGCSKDQVT